LGEEFWGKRVVAEVVEDGVEKVLGKEIEEVGWFHGGATRVKVNGTFGFWMRLY